MVAQSVPRPYRTVRSGGEQRPFKLIMLTMYTVYVLKDKDGKLYKGMTNNLPRRIQEHRNGHTITTAKMSELEIIYTEMLENKAEARKRELYLKTAAGRRFLKNKVLGW